MNKPARDEFGRIRPGSSGNPGGRSRALTEINKLAQSHCSRAVEKLAELMELPLLDDLGNVDAPVARVVGAACVAMLNRGLGKPVQPVEDVTNASDLSDSDFVRKMAEAGFVPKPGSPLALVASNGLPIDTAQEP